MRFFRTNPPKKYKDYRKYRPFTRRDFRKVCAHCFRHEDEVGGEEAFVQDHFEPKHRPNVDPADYLNLYWSCAVCNSARNKGAKWPTPAEAERGEGFCDPCHHDPVGSDYVEDDDGMLTPLTPAGRYTVRHIRLNDRRILVNIRLHRKRVHKEYATNFARLRSSLEYWRSRNELRPDQEANETCATLSTLVEAYESFVSRQPFMCYFPFPPEIPDELIAGI